MLQLLRHNRMQRSNANLCLPFSAPQIRKRRPTPATLVIYNDPNASGNVVFSLQNTLIVHKNTYLECVHKRGSVQAVVFWVKAEKVHTIPRAPYNSGNHSNEKKKKHSGPCIYNFLNELKVLALYSLHADTFCFHFWDFIYFQHIGWNSWCAYKALYEPSLMCWNSGKFLRYCSWRKHCTESHTRLSWFITEVRLGTWCVKTVVLRIPESFRWYESH